MISGKRRAYGFKLPSRRPRRKRKEGFSLPHSRAIGAVILLTSAAFVLLGILSDPLSGIVGRPGFASWMFIALSIVGSAGLLYADFKTSLRR